MSENPSIGLLFKEALSTYSDKYKDDDGVCGIKIDLRSQNIDLIVGIRFVDGESHFTVCTAGNNCEGADDTVFDLLSSSLKNIGVESKSGAGIMIKRNVQIVTTDEGCETIQENETAETSEEAPKKRGGLFGLFGKK
jgi:hypothetical protein